MTNIHNDLRRITVEDWLTIPGQDKFTEGHGYLGWMGTATVE